MNQRGFTLVELSIVLVIIGLLVGGVLTGQSLIRAAELRSVTSQEQRYVAAVQTFRDKYFALPGDMTNATAYWGIAAGSTGNDATCQAAASTTSATCNGDGNGKVGLTTVNNENFRFWQHLANAGLIEGNYTGTATVSTTIGTTSSNAPAGRIASTLWFASDFGSSTGAVIYFDGQYDNSFYIGKIQASGVPNGPVFKPEDAYNIDAKMDDGKPATGKVVMLSSFTSHSCTDTTSSSNMAANYLLTNTAIDCALFFRQAF